MLPSPKTRNCVLGTFLACHFLASASLHLKALPGSFLQGCSGMSKHKRALVISRQLVFPTSFYIGSGAVPAVPVGLYCNAAGVSQKKKASLARSSCYTVVTSATSNLNPRIMFPIGAVKKKCSYCWCLYFHEHLHTTVFANGKTVPNCLSFC